VNRIVQIDRYGGPEVLSIVQEAVGEPGPGQVLIRHRAVGLNFTDTYQRNGVHPVKYPFPMRLGMEAAGDVEAVGAGVTHLRVGDRVAYASHPPGSYSDARVIDAQNVVRFPDEIDYDTAAAMMLKGLTAQYLLKQCVPAGGLQAGDFVLFHAAAGGVGLILCQWAKHLGLRLIGTAGTDKKCHLALENGASHAINYRTQDFAKEVDAITGGKGVKIVWDAVGKDTWEGSLRSLRPFGLLVNFGDASGPIPPLSIRDLGGKSLYVTRQSVFNFLTSRQATQAMAADVIDVVRSGAVRIHIAQRYALADVARAHRDIEARETIGSTVLVL
jgi:NADPH2:quinone reductase